MYLPEPVLEAIARLEAAGHEAVAVGGCVRDFLMGRAPGDYDLATSARPEQVMEALSGCRIVPTGLKHGTVTLVADGMAIEITTYRVDGAYLDHRRPEDVRFTGSLLEDLKRRDFTVNAIAFSPARGLIDPMGGRRDILEKWIRAVGDPAARFQEDALRILRALRFASRLGFAIEPDTARAMHALKDSLSFVARERVGAEVEGLLLGAGAAEVVRAHRAVAEAALPELAAIPEHAWARALERLSRAPKDPAARLAALLSPLEAAGESVTTPAALTPSPPGAEAMSGPATPPAALPTSTPDAEAALWSLRLPGKTIDRALKLIGWLNRGEIPPARALGALGPEDARALFRTAGEDPAALEKLIESDACVTVGQLAVDGRDLGALGLRGPAVGEALRWLLDRVIAGAPNERDALLSLLGRRPPSDAG